MSRGDEPQKKVGGVLKKVVVVCGEGLGDEKHVRIRKRKI